MNWAPFIILVATGFAIWALSPILLPFVLGMVIAYFLDPLMEKLVKWGLPRHTASLVPVLLFLTALIMISMAAVPAILGDALAFSRKLPEYLILLEDDAP